MAIDKAVRFVPFIIPLAQALAQIVCGLRLLFAEDNGGSHALLLLDPGCGALQQRWLG